MRLGLDDQHPVRGTVRVERLGPPHRQFKIVREIGGRRRIVDQDTKVEDPFRVTVRWEPTIQAPKHFALLSNVTP